MQFEKIADLSLFYEPEEIETARLVAAACERSVPLFQRRWGLSTPEDCQVYVMTSWLRFLFNSAPWPWKVYLALTLPLVVRKASSIWPYAGGWSLQYGLRRVVGIKPSRLIQIGNRSLGEQIFIQDRDADEMVQTVTCHELIHAFTSHLKLPVWLHEGLAMLAMEYYLDRRMVRFETLEILDEQVLANLNKGNGRLQVNQPQALVAQTVCGYWLTRYIDEARPELLKELLTERRSHPNLEVKIVSAFGKNKEQFWKEIYNELGSWFHSKK